MARTTPNSTVEFFGDLGLSPSHTDTLYFDSTEDKDTAFSNFPKLTATPEICTYIRRDGRDYIRVSKSISSLIGCSYIRFKNTEFENKWFYAFVDSVEYLNNGTTELQFHIDQYMTWLGSFYFANCLVVREHTRSDNAYEHLLEEPVPTGDYIVSHTDIIPFSNTAEFSDQYVAILSASISPEDFDSTDNTSIGRYEGYMMCSGYREVFPLTENGRSNLELILNAYITNNKSDAILGLQIVPRSFLTHELGESEEETASYHYQWESTWKSSAHDINGYTPVNKKLFNYPYCMCELFNCEGSANEYRYEFFNNNFPKYDISGIALDISEGAAIPYNYKGSEYKLDESLIMHQFAQGSLALDQYKAWVAQMNSGGWLNIIGKIASSTATGFLAGGVPGAAISGGMSAVNSAIGVISEQMKYDSLPPAIMGTANSQIMLSQNHKKFTLFHKTITKEYAQIIDEFFTMYGYKVNRVKTPSLYNRSKYTYVQTNGCSVHGSIPAEASAEIESMLDTGCRFWRNQTEIGDFSINNAPLGN